MTMTRIEERAWEDLARAARRVKELQSRRRQAKAKKPRGGKAVRK
jgi:hypothetical protein